MGCFGWSILAEEVYNQGALDRWARLVRKVSGIKKQRRLFAALGNQLHWNTSKRILEKIAIRNCPNHKERTGLIPAVQRLQQQVADNKKPHYKDSG